MSEKDRQAKKDIDFSHTGIGTVLKNNRLVVPINQREYAWERKHVTELLHDFTNAVTLEKIYFLGTLVLIDDESAPEVADGQQRLATTTIILAAIRDYFYKKNETLLVEYLTSFLTAIDPNLKERVSKLTLNLDDNHYFNSRILSPPDSPERAIEPTKDSHHRINDAAKWVANHIENILRVQSESNKESALNEWRDFIEKRAMVIVLTVSDELDAFMMFETLNDRGLKTSQIDLVKNYLFGAAKDRIKEAQQKWQDMTSTLEALDADDVAISYFRHLLSAIYGMTRDGEIFERIKNNIKGRGQTINFLDTLAKHSNDYAAILNPEHTKWNTYNASIRDSIRTLNNLQAVPLRHLMLSTALRFEPAEAVKAFRLFIAWAVRFLVTKGGRGGALEQAYAESSKKVYDGEITTTNQLADSLVKYIPSDAQFQTEFAFAEVKKAKLARYLLRSLELKVKGSLEPEFVPNEDIVINLEHVLPENPKKGEWGVDAQTARTFYTRLGNMVLLQASKNNAIGNKSFAEKLSVLAHSAYLLTQDVAANQKWGVLEIEARQKKLAELAVKTWSLDIK